MGIGNIKRSVFPGHGQHSCEHTLQVPSPLVAVFTRVATLVLVMPRNNVLPLLVLFILATRFTGSAAVQ